MAEYQVLLTGLRRAEQDFQAKLDAVRALISSLESGSSTVPSLRRGPGRPKKSSGGVDVGNGRKKRVMSAAGRARIAAAQKARWAKVRAEKAGAKVKRTK